MSKILPKTFIRPIDSYMLWTVTDKNLNIRVCGGNIQLTCDLPVDGGGENFEIAIPVTLLMQTISLFTEPLTMFSYNVKNDTGVLSIKSGKKSAYKITGEPASAYPLMATNNPDNSLKIRSTFFKKAILSAYSFIDVSEMAASRQPALQGISIKHKGEYVAVCGLAQFALCNVTVMHDDVSQWNDVIIPRQMGEIINEVMNDDEDIVIHHDGNKLEIPGKLFNIRCTLLDYKFPAVEHILVQRESCLTININRNEFTLALKRIKLYNDKEKSIVLDIKDTELSMSAESQLFSSHGHEVLETESEKDIRIGLNIDQLIVVMSKIESDSIRFSYIDETKSAFIEPGMVSDTGEPYRALFLLNPFKI